MREELNRSNNRKEGSLRHGRAEFACAMYVELMSCDIYIFQYILLSAQSHGTAIVLYPMSLADKLSTMVTIGPIVTRETVNCPLSVPCEARSEI
jgi:hypothetical protein